MVPYTTPKPANALHQKKTNALTRPALMRVFLNLERLLMVLLLSLPVELVELNVKAVRTVAL